MSRWRCVCAYDGAAFAGWQSQPGGLAVQDVIEARLAMVCGGPLRIHASGRTDSGVHAAGQVFHFDATWDHGEAKLTAALSAGLPPTLRIKSIRAVPDTFHARFSATGKIYRYNLRLGDADPFDRPYCWCIFRALDVGAMRRAAESLLGRHDFKAFCADTGREAGDTVRDLRRLEVAQRGRRLIVTAEADGFLYKMVRSLVGVLVEVGLGKIGWEEVSGLLASRTRTARVLTAPARGLRLERVLYDGSPRRLPANSKLLKATGEGIPSNLPMHFDKPTYSVRRIKKKDIPQGLYTKDPLTGEILFNKEIEDNQMVVPKSGHHFPIPSRMRIQKLLDPNSFVETHAGVRSSDPLKFVDSQPYPERIKRYERESGLPEAVICGTGAIHGIPIALAVMDFRFCGGAMGSAAGEKITRTIEEALARKVPCLIVSASGGARMQEGIYSLMQMAKTSVALGRLAAAGIPYISILTHPTMGGVTASFATLGDVILAEPGALIGFAGSRVIKDTTKQTLPPGFQTAEFLLRHGLIDQIVSRLDMRERLHELLTALYLRKIPPASPPAS